jgi:hypothetical protein
MVCRIQKDGRKNKMQNICLEQDSGLNPVISNGGIAVKPLPEKTPTPFNLYVSNCFQNNKNTYYPNEKVIQSIDGLRKAVKYDHIFSKTENGYRSREKCLGSNCLYADIDNEKTENETEWITPERFITDFKGYEFYLVSSRNHLIEKDGMKARPKFHIYFPIGKSINDVKVFETYLVKLTRHYKYFDASIKDASRFFYGINAGTRNHFILYNHGETIIKLLDTITIQKNTHDKSESIENKIPKGERNTKLFSIARQLYNNGKNETEILEEIKYINANLCESPLEDGEIETIISSAKKYINKIYTENGILYFDNRETAVRFTMSTS